MKVLDLGCGRGAGTSALKERFGKTSEVYGIDLEKKNIEIAKRDFGKKCNFVLAGGEKIPFKKNFFDVVSSVEVLEHVTNLDKTLKEVLRVLKKQGIFISTFPNARSEKELKRLNKEYLKQIGHRRIIDIEEFRKLVERNFEIKEIKIYNSVEHLYWKVLFKKCYKITGENGDLNKPAPRLLTLFENIFNPDKEKFKYKIIKILNIFFSNFSFVFDLFFTKKRVKIIMVKK